MENALSWQNFYKHPRFWRHAFVWGIFFGFVLLVVGLDAYYNSDHATEEGPSFNFYIFLIEFMVLIYASFYAYNKLVPKKKYLLFFGIVLLLIIVISLVDGVLEIGSVQMGEMTGFLANMLFFPLFIIVAFGVKLAYHGGRQLLVIERLEARQTESELKLLKSQINPHFLFNTLNNIYATNLEDSEKANDIVLGLAGLLRYQLESNSKQKALLADEIESLENYIALEKIRVLDCDVEIKKKGDFGDIEIVPLLLLPFVENAFKYGTGIEPGSIEIRFELNENNYFAFYCRNRIVQKKGKIHSSGIGLNNVKKRLQLMYKNKHQLDINDENNYFKINLGIQL